MAVTFPLPADLPVNWQTNQIVSPNGTEAGLTAKHGYNYLMQQVNAAQEAANQNNDAIKANASATVPVSRGGTGATTATAARNNLDAAQTSAGIAVLLLSSDWAADSESGDFVCIKTGISRVTAASNLVVSPASTAEDMASWSKFGIYASAQAAGSVTFRAKNQPDSTVRAQVLVLG